MQQSDRKLGFTENSVTSHEKVNYLYAIEGFDRNSREFREDGLFPDKCLCLGQTDVTLDLRLVDFDPYNKHYIKQHKESKS